MSSIAMKWVSELTVGNQTAKQLLQFLSSHNFAKPGFFFKVETIAKQMEVSVRAVQKAFKLLQEKNLIIKEARFDEDTGRQTTNAYYLNIPESYVDNYFGEGERNASLGVHHGQGGDASGAGGVRKKTSNYNLDSTIYRSQANPNNNKINNKINNNNKRGKKRKTARTSIPINFQPNESHELLAAQQHLDVEREKNAFIDYYEAHGKKMANWNAAFSSWLRKASEFNKKLHGKEHPVTASIRELKNKSQAFRNFLKVN